MATGRSVRFWLVLGALVPCVGCVERRFVIESNVPNAQVYINDKPIGAAPAHTPFEYYGHYNVTIVEPGYETLTQRVRVGAPWYGYPPFDFFAEVLYPFQIRDTRRYFFQLQPAARVRNDDLLNSADGLRLRGQNLPSPERPALPKPRPPQPPPPQPGPRGVPSQPGAVVPSVQP